MRKQSVRERHNVVEIKCRRMWGTGKMREKGRMCRKEGGRKKAGCGRNVKFEGHEGCVIKAGERGKILEERYDVGGSRM